LWADAAAGQLWAAQRLGPAGAPPAEVWRALAALGARPRRLAWLANTLLVRPGDPTVLHSLGQLSRLLADQRCTSGCAACCPARLASMQSLQLLWVEDAPLAHVRGCCLETCAELVAKQHGASCMLLMRRPRRCCRSWGSPRAACRTCSTATAM
jgi:hypothetical protein